MDLDLVYIFPGKVLSHLLFMMREGENNVQRRVALALAHLCSPEDQRTIFIDNNGMLFAKLVYKVSIATTCVGTF